MALVRYCLMNLCSRWTKFGCSRLQNRHIITADHNLWLTFNHCWVNREMGLRKIHHIGTGAIRTYRSWFTSSIHRYGNCTENVIFRLFFVFFLPGIFGEQNPTLQCRWNRSAHVSWTLHYSRLSFAYSGQFKLLCEENLCFLCKTWICTLFDHLASTLDVTCSAQRGLSNTETMLFGVCFAFLICIQTNLECFLTD